MFLGVLCLCLSICIYAFVVGENDGGCGDSCDNGDNEMMMIVILVTMIMVTITTMGVMTTTTMMIVVVMMMMKIRQ